MDCRPDGAPEIKQRFDSMMQQIQRRTETNHAPNRKETTMLTLFLWWLTGWTDLIDGLCRIFTLGLWSPMLGEYSYGAVSDRLDQEEFEDGDDDDDENDNVYPTAN